MGSDADRQRPQLLALVLQALVRYFSGRTVHTGIGDPLKPRTDVAVGRGDI
jgi:hypothetical protein